MSAASILHSEEAIIQGYLAPLAAGAPGALGLKDDCAVISPSAGCELVLKTDAIAEGVHFLPTDAPADIGWKALAVNVSDLAAKGARPVGYLLSLAFPAAPTADWMGEFARGLGEAQAAFGMHLLGGDTDRRPGPISITPTVMGEAPVGRMVRRTTACAADHVYVSGSLGDSGLGLLLCQKPELARAWNIDVAAASYLQNRYRRPAPRLALATAVLQHARASMDISDGLLKDLGRMCRASGVGASIDQMALPFSLPFARVQAADPAAAKASMFAGDDYEILAAVSPEKSIAFEAAARAAGVAVTSIGRFNGNIGEVALLDASGAPIDTGSSGWDHF